MCAAVAETKYLIAPVPQNPKLTEKVSGVDQSGSKTETAVTVERPLTLFLYVREIVTMMTICDYPKYLAIGYLLNQNMLKKNDKITGVDYDEEISKQAIQWSLQRGNRTGRTAWQFILNTASDQNLKIKI